MLGTPDGVLSTVTRSVAAIGDGGHGGDMAGGEELSAPTASVLEEESKPGERGKRHRSSQRVQRWPRRARGGTGASRASRGISGGRRWKRRRWRRFRRPAGASFGLVKR